MKPFFFGDEDKQLYGVYSPPAAPAEPARSVLICHPTGHEYLYAYRALGQLARQCSADGLHVLRFDYFGTGNSAGASGEGTIAQWTTDILYAAEELDELSGGAELSLIGLRAGAALAAAVTGMVGGIRDLVLWDPITCGRSYLEELKETHEKVCGREVPAEPRFADQLLGFPYPPALREGIGEIDLLRAPLAAKRTVLITSEETEASKSFRARFEGSGEAFEAHRVSGPLRWYADAAEPHGLRAGGLTLRTFADVLSGGAA